MARSASDVFNPEIGGPGADGDAVVAGGDLGVENGDSGGGLDVDAVGVGTVSGGRNPNSLHLHVVAPIEHYVEHLAVHRCHSNQLYVLRVGKSQCLSQILYNSISLLIDN